MFDTFKQFLTNDKLTIQNLVLIPGIIGGVSCGLYNGYCSLQHSIAKKKTFLVKFIVAISGSFVGFLIGISYGVFWPITLSVGIASFVNSCTSSKNNITTENEK